MRKTMFILIATMLPIAMAAHQPSSDEPKLIHEVRAVYPREACANNTKGRVVVKALVDESGKPTKVIAQSGATMFRRSAVEAVKQWRWAPWVLNGKVTAFVTHIEIDYQGFFTEGCGSMLADKIMDWGPQ